MSPRFPASSTKIFRISFEDSGLRARKKSTQRTIGNSSSSASRIATLLPPLNFTRHPRAAASASFFERRTDSMAISLFSFPRIVAHGPDLARSPRRIKRHSEHGQRPAKPRPRLASQPEQPLRANELNPFRRPRLQTGQKVHCSPQSIGAANAKRRQPRGVFVNPKLLFLRPETHSNVMRPEPFNLLKDGLIPIFRKRIILQRW